MGGGRLVVVARAGAQRALLATVLVLARSSAAPAVLVTVDSTGDGTDSLPGDGACDTGGGVCTLRAAIEEINGSAGGSIEFDIPGAGVRTIQPNSALPAIDPAGVVIDGYTQPGAAVNTSQNTDNAVLLIEINGANAGAADGLTFSQDGTVRGLVINGFLSDGVGGNGDGLVFQGSGSSIVQGNFIGTDPSGSFAVPNQGVGIDFGRGLIGGLNGYTDRNIVSGNGEEGIRASGAGVISGLTIQRNFIGTDASSAIPIPNADSGLLSGPATVQENVISGNGFNGASVAAPCDVRGNRIGVDSTGMIRVQNDSSGLIVGDTCSTTPCSSCPLTRCTVGGLNSGDRNIISGNAVEGLIVSSCSLVIGNYIGTNETGTAAISNLDGITINGDKNQIGTGSISVGVGCNGACNLVSGNTMIGIGVNKPTRVDNFGDGVPNQDNNIEGNFVGTDVSGTQAINNNVGVNVNNAIHTSIFGNLVSGNTPGAGIGIQGGLATDNTVYGNFVGTDITGLVALGNNNSGVFIRNSSMNTVGGETSGVFATSCSASGSRCDPGAVCNVISGNSGGGVTISNQPNALEPTPSAASNVVAGNFIGTDRLGTSAIGNAVGVQLIAGAHMNTIGGNTNGARNLVSGNNGHGVNLTSGATTNWVRGNYIGIAIDGTALGNAGAGVRVNSIVNNVSTTPDTTRLCTNNVIGGASGVPAAACSPPCNFIANNSLAGVLIDIGLGQSSSSTPDVFPGDNTVEGNFVGTNRCGDSTYPNSLGVSLLGHQDVVRDNLISGNTGDGIRIGEKGKLHTVEGNFIGTAASGLSGLSNGGNGVLITTTATDVRDAAAANTIGDGNLIAANSLAGVFISGPTAAYNVVRGNQIGVDVAGAALANGGDGVRVEGPANSVGGTAGTTPGGACTGACNYIAFNGGRGVLVDGAANNLISANSMVGNALLGIDLAADGVTANDDDDPDGGANLRQNSPVLTSATLAAGTLNITGFMDTSPNTQFILEFFANSTCDPSTYGEGQSYLGSATTVTNDCGFAGFNAMFPAASGPFITATATDPANDTSEFSLCCEVNGICTLTTPTPCPSATPTSSPTFTFTSAPSATPSSTPTNTPTSTRTDTPLPSATPTATLTNSPTSTPTDTPLPSATPSATPTQPCDCLDNISGAYSVSITQNSPPCTWTGTTTLLQNGTSLSANYLLTGSCGNSSGTSSGTIAGASVTLQTTATPVATFLGVVLSGCDTLSGQWSLPQSAGGGAGSWSATRIGSVPPCDESEPPIEHFSCHVVRNVAPQQLPTGASPLLTLVDRFASVSAKAKRPKMLCAPTNKNGEDPAAPWRPTHLTLHKLKPPITGTAGPPYPNLLVTDQFGTLYVTVKKPKLMLVPTYKRLAPPSPPQPIAPAIDHFLCHEIVKNGGGPFPEVGGVTVQNQFGPATVAIRPEMLCSPLNKNGEDPTAPSHPDQLTCYELVGLVPPSVNEEVWIGNQFGPGKQKVKKMRRVCLPSTIGCGGRCSGGPNQAGECVSDAGCPGGQCIISTCCCVDDAMRACTVNADCPMSSCQCFF